MVVREYYNNFYFEKNLSESNLEIVMFCMPPNLNCICVIGYDDPYLVGILQESVEIVTWGLETPVEIKSFTVKARAFTRAKSGVCIHFHTYIC